VGRFAILPDAMVVGVMSLIVIVLRALLRCVPLPTFIAADRPRGTSPLASASKPLAWVLGFAPRPERKPGVV
jgi:hypothetical protein